MVYSLMANQVTLLPLAFFDFSFRNQYAGGRDLSLITLVTGATRLDVDFSCLPCDTDGLCKMLLLQRGRLADAFAVECARLAIHRGALKYPAVAVRCRGGFHVD